MLVLSRRKGEMFVIRNKLDPSFKMLIGISEIRGESVRLGFLANDNIVIHRHEVDERIQRGSGKGEGRSERMLVSLEGANCHGLTKRKS